jgi:hypothetical protein
MTPEHMKPPFLVSGMPSADQGRDALTDEQIAYVAAFMDGLSWMLANRDSKPAEWKEAAMLKKKLDISMKMW